MPLRALLDAALARRAALRLGATDALRLVDGEGDDLPGLFLDTFAGRYLVSTTSPELPRDFRRWCEQSGRTTYWKKLDQHERTAPQHLAGPPQDEPFMVTEHGARFRIDIQAGYSQGLFLDQRDNRQRVRSLCRAGATVLNTFAYTGAFSVCAALGGATTTTLDLSQPYLDWARDNFRLNGLGPAAHFFCKGDTFHWLRRFAKQGRAFDGIILDPPTFSRDDKGNVFRAESDYGRLVELAAGCLSTGGWLLCTTNCRRLPRVAFEKTVRQALPRANTESFPMPADFTGEPYLKTLRVVT